MVEEETKDVSREDVVAWYKDQLELATLRADLAEQHARATGYESQRLQHMVMIANIKTASENIAKEEDESPENIKS